MSFSKSYNKYTGVTYVYEVIEGKWNPERKRCEQKRKLVGKLGPNGEVIPTGPVGRPKNTTNADLTVKHQENMEQLAQERKKVKDLNKQQKKMNDTIAHAIEEQEKNLSQILACIKAMSESNQRLLALLAADAQSDNTAE